jgi:multimeric flavodoxin WrbA
LIGRSCKVGGNGKFPTACLERVDAIVLEELMTKILAIQGSPRRQGNTQAVLEVVLRAAQDAGAAVESIELCQMQDLTGCQECNACKKKADEPGCAIDDDLQDVLEKAIDSDLVVWATPVFCWAPSWLAKMAMDRFYCMFKYRKDGQIDSLLEGRKMAAVITAGGSEDDGADLVAETCKRMAAFSKCEWLGSLVADNVTNRKSIRADTDLIERAERFGRKLAS